MPFEKTIRVLIVEDSPSDLEIATAELTDDDRAVFEISSARSLERALTEIGRQVFDAILLDLNVVGSYGLDTVKAVLHSAPDIPVVVLTGCDDEDVGLEAVAMGAQDYLVKGFTNDGRLGRALRVAIQRQDWRIARLVDNSQSRNSVLAERLKSLSRRELDALNLMVSGISLKQLALKLGVGVQTAAKHRSRVLEKMNVENDVQLVRMFFDSSSK